MKGKNMKIKVAVFDKNTEYMKRLAKVFQKKYGERITLSLFSNEELLYEGLKETPAELLLIDQDIKLDETMIPQGLTIGYLSKNPAVEEINGIPTIGKYQKAEEIYNQMISLYAEKAGRVSLKKTDLKSRVLLFTSAQGGSGVSTTAVAYALRRAEEKKKVLLLNLEKFGSSDMYFFGEGNLSFSDIIYSLKSKNSNLLLKLESSIQMDPSGIDFFKDCKNAYDMFELEDSEIEELVCGIAQVKKYDEIVIDYAEDATGRLLRIIQDFTDKVIYVSDGTPSGNRKFERFCEVARVLESRTDRKILNKMNLLYNRYSSKNSEQIERTAVPVAGGIQRIEGLSGRALSEKIKNYDCIGSL